MSELSYTIRLDQIGSSPVQITLEANQSEKTELCDRFGYESIDHLSSNVRIDRLSRDGYFKVSGDLKAAISQNCAITLEPVAEEIETSFSELLSDGVVQDEDEITLDPEDEDAEPIEDGVIDVGEIVAQQLALSANPYPRSNANDDAEMVFSSPANQIAEIQEDSDKPQNPFAVLAKIRDKTGNRN